MQLKSSRELKWIRKAFVPTPCSFTLPRSVPTVCWRMDQTMMPKDTANLERKPDVHTF